MAIKDAQVEFLMLSCRKNVVCKS